MDRNFTNMKFIIFYKKDILIRLRINLTFNIAFNYVVLNGIHCIQGEVFPLKLCNMFQLFPQTTTSAL